MVLWQKHHVQLYENDAWNNWKLTRGTSIKRHLQHLESDMWTNRHATLGQNGHRHMGHRENDTWTNREKDTWKNWKMTHVSCSYHHVDCYQLATSLSSLQHVLPATLAASVDKATWSASMSHGGCQHKCAHVDPGLQWRFSNASTKQNWFPGRISFRRRKNILVTFWLYRQGRPNSMLHFWRTKFLY